MFKHTIRFICDEVSDLNNSSDAFLRKSRQYGLGPRRNPLRTFKTPHGRHTTYCPTSQKQTLGLKNLQPINQLNNNISPGISYQ